MTLKTLEKCLGIKTHTKAPSAHRTRIKKEYDELYGSLLKEKTEFFAYISAISVLNKRYGENRVHIALGI